MAEHEKDRSEREAEVIGHVAAAVADAFQSVGMAPDHNNGARLYADVYELLDRRASPCKMPDFVQVKETAMRVLAFSSRQHNELREWAEAERDEARAREIVPTDAMADRSFTAEEVDRERWEARGDAFAELIARLAPVPSVEETER